MNLNIIAYIFYFSATVFIILKVGNELYHHGGVYLKSLYPNNEEIVLSLNKMLRMGYYLLNIGYVAFSLFNWPHIYNTNDFIVALSTKIGFIGFILGAIHFINMIWVRMLEKFNVKL